MGDKLNIQAVKEAMKLKGLSPSQLAKNLDVTRESVSKWLSGKKYPRPGKLLKIALMLKLDFEQLVRSEFTENTPIVAFRKKGTSKTKDKHIAQALYMGNLLASLVPYLPFDRFISPPVLKNPQNSYGYFQDVAKMIRKEIGLKQDSVLDFIHLIDKFTQLQTVLIPVMWGEKKKHENALHIFLPKSMTTWVYLNLDTHIHDFKFWMAHELGHVLSSSLRNDEAEDFADGFAAALLFPEEIAALAYEEVSSSNLARNKINIILETADRYTISPITIYLQMNKYAESNDLPKIDLDSKIYPATTNFNKNFIKVSGTIFKDKIPTSKAFIKTVSKEFNTPFFDSLKSFLKDSDKSSGYIQTLLNISMADSKGIYAELC